MFDLYLYVYLDISAGFLVVGIMFSSQYTLKNDNLLSYNRKQTVGPIGFYKIVGIHGVVSVI